MTREEACALLDGPREEAVAQILELAHKAAQWDQQSAPADPLQPSATVAPFKKPAAPRRPRKPGRKPGHPGACRPVPETIDARSEHRLESCPDCGHPVGAAIRSHTRLIEDLVPGTVETHAHTVHGHWCGHCQKIVTPTVTAALPRATLGLNVVLYSAWLHYRLGISVGNLVTILQHLFGLRVSAGGLTQAWIRLGQTLAPYGVQLEQAIRQAGVLHADETGWRVNGTTHWLWAFCTQDLAYFRIERRRNAAVVYDFLGEIFDGLLVCDFYAAYNAVEAWAKQRCLFHLFAELRRVDQRNTSIPWREARRRIQRLFQDAIRLKLRRTELEPRVYQRRKRRLHQRLDELIATRFADADATRLVKRLANFRGELLTFLDHDDLPPTNNRGEQEMRNPVLARKVCQQNRSEVGAATHALLLSLFRTAELQGHEPLAFLRQLTEAAIAGQPLELIHPAATAQAA